MNKKQITKNQHFVPQVYLRKFGPDGLLDQYYIEDKRIMRKKSIKKHLCCKDWFYEFLARHEDEKTFIQIINYLEDRFCEIESKYSYIYNKIIQEIEYSLETDKKVELSEEDVLFLKEFIALQAVRTNKAFSIARNELIRVGIDLNSLTPEAQNTTCIHCLFPKELHNDTRIEEAMYDKFLGKMKNKDYNMVFLKIVDDEARFFTSDSPVVVMEVNNQYNFLLPLNEKYAIFICNLNGLEKTDKYSVIRKDKQNVNDLNKEILASADKYIMANNFTCEEIEFLQSIN